MLSCYTGAQQAEAPHAVHNLLISDDTDKKNRSITEATKIWSMYQIQVLIYKDDKRTDGCVLCKKHEWAHPLQSDRVLLPDHLLRPWAL